MWKDAILKNRSFLTVSIEEHKTRPLSKLYRSRKSNPLCAHAKGDAGKWKIQRGHHSFLVVRYAYRPFIAMRFPVDNGD